MKYLLKVMHALFTSAGAAREQTEVFQHWQNGSSKEDTKQEGTGRNKEKSKHGSHFGKCACVIYKVFLSNLKYCINLPLVLVSVFRRMSGQRQRFMRNFLLLLKEEGRAKSRPLSVVVLQMQQKVKYLHYGFCI